VGAQKAFDLLYPALSQIDPTLASTIRSRFQEVVDSLGPYRQDPGHENSGFVNYDQVEQAERRALAQTVDALAEPLSQVAAKVA